MKRNRLRQSASVYIARRPAEAVLLSILLFNIFFILFSAGVIFLLSGELSGAKGFWISVFYTVTMILDAGCISSVITDVGTAGTAVIIACLTVIIIGMITFTGAMIGYITSCISGFIDSDRAGSKKLRAAGHTVIINWNTRGSEIINDMLYCGERETVVIFVEDGKKEIEREISDRVAETLQKERTRLRQELRGLSPLRALKRRKAFNALHVPVVVVREGNIFSLKQLGDISVETARTVIILGKDDGKVFDKGNALLIKTLIQVTELTASDASADAQQIVVEVEDEWTLRLVYDIIESKQRISKCNIVPVPVNRILGQILSQFAIMPELNRVYSELFSYRGALFTSEKVAEGDLDKSCDALVRKYLASGGSAVPLGAMDTKFGRYMYFVSDSADTPGKTGAVSPCTYTAKLSGNDIMSKKNVIILGHNGEMRSILRSFDDFCREWNRDGNALNIMMIDDAAYLRRHSHFDRRSYITRTVEADVYDQEIICTEINDFCDLHGGNVSIMILSDGTAPASELDSKVLTYMIYVQDIVRKRSDRDSISVIAEVIEPGNADVVSNYSIDNIVISNRYVSKMITQIGRQAAMYEFYTDILTYDSAAAGSFSSKEMYVKAAGDFLGELPGRMTGRELMRGVYEAGTPDNRAVVIGYMRGGSYTLFSGGNGNAPVELLPDDKLIIYANH